MDRVPIIDADGHILEENDEIEDYFEGPYEGHRRHKVFTLFPSLDGWPRGAVKGLKKATQTSPESWTAFIDGAGIDAAVLYPTAGLGFGLIQDSDWACALARAYNNWFYDKYNADEPAAQRGGHTAGARRAAGDHRAAPCGERAGHGGGAPAGGQRAAQGIRPLRLPSRSTRRRNGWTARWLSTAPPARGSVSISSRPCP